MDDERLHAFVVWGPMLGEEERADAPDATRFLDDPRSTHFWTPAHDLADVLSPVAGLPDGERAWDTFMVFAPGQSWGDEPPEPVLVQHVGKSLPAEQRLHGPTMLDQVEALLGPDGGGG